MVFCGCSSLARPCHEGGDLSWPGLSRELRGDIHCRQKKVANRYVNHGRFFVYSRAGKVLLEGEFFEGKRQGTWVQYDDQGAKLAEKFFDNGMEKTSTAAPAATQKR
jgi:hypothetical protein